MLPVIVGILPLARLEGARRAVLRGVVASQTPGLRVGRLVDAEDEVEPLRELEATLGGKGLEPGARVFEGAERLARRNGGDDALGLARVGQRVLVVVGKESEHGSQGFAVSIPGRAPPVMPGPASVRAGRGPRRRRTR